MRDIGHKTPLRSHQQLDLAGHPVEVTREVAELIAPIKFQRAGTGIEFAICQSLPQPTAIW